MNHRLDERFLAGALGKRLPIILVLCAFVLVELVLFHSHSFPLTRGETDGIGYMARATGPLFQVDPFHGPGYSLAIKVFQSMGMAPFASAKFVSLIFGILLVLVTWLLLSSFSTPREAILGTILVAFSPITLVRSVTILSDMMAASLFLSTLALLLAPKQTRMWHFILAGAMAGLAYLTRHIYIVLLAVPVIYWLFCSLRRGERIKSLMNPLVFYVAFLVVALPWFIFMVKMRGNPFWNENYLNIAFKMHQNAGTWNVFPSSDQYRGLTDLIFSDPVLFFRSWMRTVYDVPWLAMGLIPRVGFISSAGVFFWLARFDRKKGVLLLAGITYGLAASLVWVENRFLLPLIPLVASFVVSCVSVIPDRISPSSSSDSDGRFIRRIPLKAIVVTILVILLLFITLGQIPVYFYDQPFEYKKAAHWLAPRVTDDASIMASKPHIAFFSRSRGISFRSYKLQNARIEQLPDILGEARPTYFIYDERYGGVEFPQFRILLDPRNNPYSDLLNPVHKIDTPRRLIIYEYKTKDIE